MYELTNSNPMKLLRSSLNKTIKYVIGQYYNSPDGDKIKEIGDELQYFYCFLKPYEGKKWNPITGEFDGKVVKFYDEREWRYVPDFQDLKNNSIKPFIRKDEFMVDSVRNAYNEQLEERFNLGFKPGDLKYIIVNTEDEVLEIAKEVSIIKDKFGYTKDEKKLLLTKIISVEKIKNDI